MQSINNIEKIRGKENNKNKTNHSLVLISATQSLSRLLPLTLSLSLSPVCSIHSKFIVRSGHLCYDYFHIFQNTTTKHTKHFNLIMKFNNSEFSCRICFLNYFVLSFFFFLVEYFVAD